MEASSTARSALIIPTELPSVTFSWAPAVPVTTISSMAITERFIMKSSVMVWPATMFTTVSFEAYPMEVTRTGRGPAGTEKNLVPPVGAGYTEGSGADDMNFDPGQRARGPCDRALKGSGALRLSGHSPGQQQDHRRAQRTDSFKKRCSHHVPPSTMEIVALENSATVSSPRMYVGRVSWSGRLLC